MKKSILLLSLSSLIVASVAIAKNVDELLPVDAANVFVGTDNSREVSHGNLYPYIAMPWGMNAWTPQTRESGQGWLYDWKDTHWCGFHQTHQPSPWIGDYAQFSVMPMVGKKAFDEKDRRTWFSHKTEVATPAYYRVYLAEYDLVAELAPTERAAMMRFTYPETDAPRFLVDALKGDAKIDVDLKSRTVTGYSTLNNIRGNEKDLHRKPLKTHFVLVFDHEIESVERDGNRALLTFKPTTRGQKINVKVASSFIDLSQARLNLRELGDETFEQIHEKGREQWNKVMGRIEVKGGTEENRRKFYTCLYRSLIFPRMTHEFNEKGEKVHWSFYQHKVCKGAYYCDTGFWDTFRALFPLLTYVYPEKVTEMMEGLEHCLDESGWLPEWSAPFHRNCMIGQNSASVIADAYFAGCIEKNRALKLYEGLLKSSTNVNSQISSVGRLGWQDYITLGYVPCDAGINSETSRTLEYAYADACIAKLGDALGRDKIETAVYHKRSQNWRNVFRDDVKLACGRDRKGKWNPKFNPNRWGYDFTEGTPLHYTWSVFQDFDGLFEAMGGKEAVVKKLDDVFASSPDFDGSFFGGCTHEIREMQVAEFGQYAHGNQPIQHMIYLYTYAGCRDKAAYWAREVMNRLYLNRPDGYCGDEDNGQTSAWFVWSAMGLYPASPLAGEYALGGGLFDEVRITRAPEKIVTISKDGLVNGKEVPNGILKR